MQIASRPSPSVFSDRLFGRPARVVLWARVSPSMWPSQRCSTWTSSVEACSVSGPFLSRTSSSGMQSQALHVALLEWGGGGNPMSIGPATPSNALPFATLNVRRLWLQDESVHGGFHMLSAILNSENVAVCCVQGPRAGAFPTLPADQCCHFEGPVESGGREAAFLYRSGVSCIPFSGVQDIVSMQWRNYQDMICV